MTNVERTAQVFIETYKKQNKIDALLALSVLLGEFFDEYNTVGEMTDSAYMILTALMSCAFRKGLNKCLPIT